MKLIPADTLREFVARVFVSVGLDAADAAMRLADEGLQIFGGHGFTRDLPLEMW